MDAGHTAMDEEVRPEPIEQAEMRPLGEIVIVHLAEHRPEAVGIDDRPARLGVGAVEADELSPGRRNLALEEAGRMATVERAERMAVEAFRLHAVNPRDGRP